MICIKQLSKSFNGHKVLDSISFTLPDHGLVGIVGSSGCGKTTLLNILSGIQKGDEGVVDFNGVDIQLLKEKELLNYRLHNVGYIFQNFNLINLETGERNVSLILDSSSNISASFRKRKVRRLFHLFKINNLRKQKVAKMSGGEKQRIAIVRAIVNNPKVVLCDEPTGSLDEKNAFEIMEILRQISVKSLVLVVSHDYELIKDFADELVFMSDGKIVRHVEQNIKPSSIPPIEENGKPIKKAKIPEIYKTRYSVGKMKSKKFRTIISNIMLSFSLTGIGVSFFLTDLVQEKISDTFRDLTNGNQIVMKLKNDSLNTYDDIFSASLKDVQQIEKKYSDEINGVGTTYLVNFEDHFKDRNEIYLLADGKREFLKNYSIRNFNEYKWYSKNIITYPYSVSLNDDDLVLGMTFEDMSNICYDLGVQRSFYSLGQFLTKTNVQLQLIVANNDWEYDDEQIFNVVGIVQTTHPLLFHSNHLWNEYVFEEQMRFPSYGGGEADAIWDMKKNYFIDVKSSLEEIENKLLFDPEYNDFVFQKITKDFSAILCNSTANCMENRLYIYYSNINGIKTTDVEYLSSFFEELSSYYFTSEYGYASYASNILSGFSKNLFVSLEETKINDAIDADTSLGNKEDVSLNLPEGISGGSYLQSLDDSLKFSTRIGELKSGRLPKNNREIVVSTGLEKKLGQNVLGKRLHIASVKSESLNINQQIEKSYSKTNVVIVGIRKEDDQVLYHSNLWTISFFRDELEINPFNLIPNGAVFELDENIDPEPLINHASELFPSYSFTNPQSELTKSMGNVMNYAQTILRAFSIVSLIISFLFLGVMVLLSVNESKDEIKMFGYLGIGKGQIRGLFRNQTLIRCLLAYLISAIEMIVIENLLSSALTSTLFKTGFTFSITLWPLLIVLLFATILPLFITQAILLLLSKRKKIE